MSSKLSDRLCKWERGGGESQRNGDITRPRMYVKREEGAPKKSHTYPILDHGNLVSPASRSEPVCDPDHGLDPFPGR